MKLSSLFALSIALATVSCATVTGPSYYSIKVSGSDSAVKAVYNGNEYSLPATINVKPAAKEIQFIKNCANPKTVEIAKDFRVGATIFGNLFWLPIGVPVDVLTGQAWKVDEQTIYAPTLIATKNCR